MTMIDKMHSELSDYQKNRFKDIETYFEKLFCNLYNLYSNNRNKFYNMIRENSKDENQILDLINQSIIHYSSIEKYEECHQLLEIRVDVSTNIKKIFNQ